MIVFKHAWIAGTMKSLNLQFDDSKLKTLWKHQLKAC